MNREMGAVVHHVHAEPIPVVGRKSGAPISRSANSSEFPNSWIGALPDIPVGWFKVQGVVSAHSQSAATVTRAGGLNGFPAFSSFVQRQAGEPGVTQRHSGLKRLPASVGGATWVTW